MEAVGGDGESQVSPLAKWRNDFSKAFQHYLDRSAPHMVNRWLGTLAAAAVYVLRVYYGRGFYVISYGLAIYILNLLIGFLSPKVDPELEALDRASLPTKDSEASLPTTDSEEFRPFIRRLPEFKFCSRSFGSKHMEKRKNVYIARLVLLIKLAKGCVSLMHANLLSPLYHSVCATILLFQLMKSVYYPFTILYFRYAITKAFCVAFLMTFFSVFDVPVFWPILFFYWVFLFFLTMKRLTTHMIKYRYVPFNIGKQRFAAKKSAESSSGSPKD